MSKILIDEATVQQVLEALEPRPGMPNPEYESLTQCAITALREALADQPAQQEPFGYFKAEPFGWTDCAETDEGAVALYTTPQPAQQEPVANYCRECLTYNGHHEGCSHYASPPAQRTWVGLTDDERAAIGKEMAKTLPNRWIDFDYAGAVEAKLKEKNA